jgi:hypothetical protein
MSRNLALVLIGLLGSLVTPASAYAQLTPPAGSAGAGHSAISGVPFGPANSSVLSEPSGISNASRIPPLRTNSPPPRLVYEPIGSSSPSRVVAPYAGASQRIFSADQVTQEGRRSAGAVDHRSESLRGFAGAVNASRTDARFWRTSRRDPGRGLSVEVSCGLRHRS